MNFRYVPRICALLLALAVHIYPAEAQDTSLTLPAEVRGQITPGEIDTYTFSAVAGGVISMSVRPEGEFDPILELLDSAGNILLVSDDYNYPDSRDSLLEAVTVPRTGTYTVQVSGYEGSAGAYNLRVYPGFSQIAANEGFDRSEGWDVSDNLSATIDDGELNLRVEGARALGSTFYQFVDPAVDVYIQARIAEVRNVSGWNIGLAARQGRSGYYMLLVNHQGLWRFDRVSSEGAAEELRDWTPHPNIVAGQTEFTLGLIANGSGFDFFYNGGYIGSAADAVLDAPGSVGIVLGAPSSLPSATTARIDNFVVTTPTFQNGERIIPDQIILGTPSEMQRSLELRHVLDPSGVLALTVPESTVEFARDGINRLMLGRGTVYGDFALGAVVEIDAARSGIAGCGLVLRYADEGEYILAYFDQAGGYGLSEREGDTFRPGLFGEDPELLGNTAQLLIIADNNTLYYYIDGNFVGQLETSLRAGEIGTAVVNYEVIDTTCRYRDIWLWRWD